MLISKKVLIPKVTLKRLGIVFYTGHLSMILCFYNFVNGFYRKPDSKTFIINDVFGMMGTFRVIRKIKFSYFNTLVIGEIVFLQIK